MSSAIESFVTAENITLYKTLLDKETHPDKRRVLLQLLEQEVQKLPGAAKRAQMIGTTASS